MLHTYWLGKITSVCLENCLDLNNIPTTRPSHGLKTKLYLHVHWEKKTTLAVLFQNCERILYELDAI